MTSRGVGRGEVDTHLWFSGSLTSCSVAFIVHGLVLTVNI